MSALRITSLVVALAIVGWVRMLPLSLDGATRGAENAVRAVIAGELASDSSAASGDVGSWIRDHPAQFGKRLEAERQRRRDKLSFESADGTTFPYLGGFDSYVWLRGARNILRHGSACDSIVDGQCRDDFTLAPVGVRGRYAASFHVGALAAFHRALRWFDRDVPLSASGFYLSFFVALLGVFPSYWLGNRFGGAIGGFVCAVVAGLNITVLYRTFGADNDVWNVVLPLFEVWAVVEAMYAGSLLRRSLLVIFAAVVTGLHAATWTGWIFTSGVVSLGLAANAALWAARLLIHGASEESRQGTRRSLALFAGYLVAATLATSVAGADATPVSAAAGMVRQVISGTSSGRAAPDENGVVEASPVDRQLRWPSVFETVGELRDPGLGGIARSMAGPVFFFVAWLGMILLMLPRQGWQSWHFILLIGGNLLYRFLLTRGGLDPYVLALLLLIPLAMGVGAYLADRTQPVEDQGAGAMIIVWFLGGLVIAHQGNRFLLLLAPPMAVLCAVAFGRLFDWFARHPWGQPLPLRAAVFVALAASVWLPVQQGRTMARSYLPLVNDGWHGVFDRLRDETAPETIVNSWWDYGYFIKYFADRRVLSDGGTLRTQVHHWFALALMSESPEESLGILRMLNCGSSAYPEPEGEQSAFGQLRAAGILRERAYATVLALASMDETVAAQYLRDMGLDETETAAVLERSHCEPAPAYLVIPSTLVFSVGWRSLGKESLIDAAAGELHRDSGAKPAVVSLVERFGLSEEQARESVQRAQQRDTPVGVPGFATASWVSCGGEGEWRCELGARLRSGDVVRAVEVDPADPAGARLILGSANGDGAEESPVSIVVADVGGVRTVPPREDGTRDISLLVDLERKRVLLGSERILRSTFAGLMFLDARYVDRFVEFDRRGSRSGQIVTWKIQW